MTITVEPFAAFDAVCDGCGRSVSAVRLVGRRESMVLCAACLADLHRLTAPTAPALTVGAFLSVAHVAEFRIGDEWWQANHVGGLRMWRPHAVNGPRWSEWWRNAWDPAEIEGEPCRLVPVDLADRDPSERAELPDARRLMAEALANATTKEQP